MNNNSGNKITFFSASMGKRYFRLFLWFVLSSFIIQACNSDDEIPNTQAPLSDEHQYFMEIAFGNEFNSGYTSIRKWSTNMKVYLPETEFDYLNNELDRIMGEINALQKSILITRVATMEEANYIIYFGDKDTYVNEYEPKAQELVLSNWGLFWIYWADFRIDHGSMYVDVVRTKDIDCQKHLLREELTQSLGLMNDSYDYPESIFYQEWTCGTEYAEIDRELIRILYDSNITPGMPKEDVIAYLRSLESS